MNRTGYIGDKHMKCQKAGSNMDQGLQKSVKHGSRFTKFRQYMWIYKNGS